MSLFRSLLLASAAGSAVAGAQAADLPAKKAVPIEYVRVCSAYGAGFFFIPGTDTCLRVSGRARYEAGYINSDNRRVAGGGDLSGFLGLMRLNVDSRTQTEYGTLRAFLRLDAASRTGHTKLSSGTTLRGAYAFSGTGIDTFGRVQSFLNVDKAFVQFAGLTAGRASSFFDFYAHDYEIIGTSLGSDLPSTNLLAYTGTFGEGFSTTLSMEDPTFRKNPVFSDAVFSTPGGGPSAQQFSLQNSPTPVILLQAPSGEATAIAFVDAIQRARMPDFVGSLRYDASWGSAQISAAVKDINIGGFLPGTVVAPGLPAISAVDAQALLAARGVTSGSQTDYGWAVQGGLKFNLPFVAPGDGLYLQAAYGEGASFYTGINRFTAGYLSNAAVYAGNPFNQFLSDAIVNPVTGKLELSNSFTVVASFLHYWSPQWRSNFYGSYGEMRFGNRLRQAVSLTSSLAGANAGASPPSAVTNPVGFALSPALRDTSQVVTGASLIWSPVKDLDVGVEGQYIRTALKSGQSTNADKGVTVAGLPLFPVSSQDTYQARFRVQRDF